jgi:hypothetical protein
VGLARTGAFLLATVAITAAAVSASVASCSYGTYDGSYDSAALDTGSGLGEAGAVTVSRTIAPDQDNQLLTTPDHVFEVTFVRGTFNAPTVVTITQLPDLTLGDGLVVPVYRISAAGVTAPNLPFQVLFHGSSNGRNVQPAYQRPDGSYALLPILGGSQGILTRGPSGGGPSATYWGITDRNAAFGTYSLKDVATLPTTGFSESANECMGCCGQNGGASAGVTVEGSCLCAQPSDPNPPCFIGRCSDTTAAVARCAALDNTNSNNLYCKPLFSCQDPCCQSSPPISANCCINAPGPGCKNCGGNVPPFCNGGLMMCPGASPCCVDSQNPNQPDNCGTTNNTCNANALAVRCEHDSDCKDGRAKCCVVPDGTLCLPQADCPPAQRVCATDTDCVDAGVDLDGGLDGACQANGLCPFGTCGSPPAACK